VAEAIRLLDKALVRTPEDPDLHFWLGVAYFRQGDDLRAGLAFETVSALRPEYARAYYNLGAVYFRQQRWPEAVRAFLAAAERMQDQRADLYLKVGLSYYKLGSAQDAIEWFQKTLAAHPLQATADTAHAMLNLLQPATAPRTKRKGTVQVAGGRQYETNVFLTAAEETPTTKRRDDWATIVSARLSHDVPIGGQATMSPLYRFWGRWYDDEDEMNYQVHELRVGLHATRLTSRPALSYAYLYTLLRNRSFLAYHQVALNSYLFHLKRYYVGIHGSWDLGNSLDPQYAYLAGTKWTIGMSETHSFLSQRGYFRAGIAYTGNRAKDADHDPRFACEFCSYSYRALEPSLQYRSPLLGRLIVQGVLQYQHRVYDREDRWQITASSFGTKRRRDQRGTGSVSVRYPLADSIDVELAYSTEINRSNLGDDSTDYVDRDYRKHAYTLNLSLTL
jgi:tetratricopeptide (TPR) repeat protein